MSVDNKAYNNILELIGNTPLVRLNKICDGFPGKYFTKYEGYNPCLLYTSDAADEE